MSAIDKQDQTNALLNDEAWNASDYTCVPAQSKT